MAGKQAATAATRITFLFHGCVAIRHDMATSIGLLSGRLALVTGKFI